MRLALFEKRCGAFFEIVGGEALPKPLNLHVKAFPAVSSQHAVEGRRQGGRCVLGNLAGHDLGGFKEQFLVHDLVHQPAGQGGFRVDHAAGEHHFHGLAFADTLFRADFTIDPEADGVLFCQRIEDPSAFGVVVTDDAGTIVDYVEKPQEWVGDLAMIGIYAFKDGARLNRELQHLIDHNVVKGGEYQLPDALRNMTNDGLKFIPGEVSEWMDCGNKTVTVETNARILSILEEEGRLDPVPASATVTDSVILQPCHIGEGVVIERSVVGPHVTLGEGTVVTDSRVSEALVASQSRIEHAVLQGAMVGSHAAWHGAPDDASIGDYCTVGTPRA